jgi:hypothetical protein
MAHHSNRFVNLSVTPLKATALVLALSAASATMAAENGLQRYSPGIGGSDMTSPLVPGWYGQVATVAYHASKLKGADGSGSTSNLSKVIPATASARTAALAPAYAAIGYAAGLPVNFNLGVKVDVQAIQPRLTYLSTKQVLGGNMGFTVMVPVIRRKADFTASGLSVPSTFQPRLTAALGGSPTAAGTAAATVSGVEGNVVAGIDAMDGTVVGMGDVEFSPIVHWEIGDHQAVTFAPTLVLPTGDYKVDRRLNPGYGNFVTFRPSVQYAYIGDGWDLGGRAVLSFNTRNKDNGYYSGTMFNLDFQAMAFVTEDVRLGLQGYWVRQIGRDTQDLSGFSAQQQFALATTSDLSSGNKASAVAAGPAVAWLRNGGEFMLEGKFLKEYKARNRTEGQAFWLTLSKPL